MITVYFKTKYGQNVRYWIQDKATDANTEVAPGSGRVLVNGEEHGPDETITLSCIETANGASICYQRESYPNPPGGGMTPWSSTLISAGSTFEPAETPQGAPASAPASAPSSAPASAPEARTPASAPATSAPATSTLAASAPGSSAPAASAPVMPALASASATSAPATSAPAASAPATSGPAGDPRADAVQAGAGGKAHVTNKPVDPALQPPQKGVNTNETLYGTETGDAADIEDTDINQGSLGDCFLLSSIGEIARIDPALIKHAIKDNGDGTFTVTLYQRKGGFWGGVKSAFGDPSFKQVQVTVDGNFPAGGSANPGTTQDVVGGKKEIWVQVVEKAYAKLHGGYSGINDGGSPTDAMEALTGEKADEKSTGGLFGGISQKDLLAAFNAGKPIVMNTPDTKKQLPFNLVPNHAYMLEDIGVDAKGKAQIKLRNPWGTTQLQPPLPIPFEKLHSGIESVDIGGTLPKDKP